MLWHTKVVKCVTSWMCTVHSLFYFGSNCLLYFWARHQAQYNGHCHVLIATSNLYYPLEGAVVRYSRVYDYYYIVCVYILYIVEYCYTHFYVASVEQVLAIWMWYFTENLCTTIGNQISMKQTVGVTNFGY